MRFRPEDSIAVRLALVATLVIAAVSMTVAITNLDASRRLVPSAIAPGATSDPELVRCRDLGMAAAEDESCIRAWSDEQRRFMGTDRTSEPQEQSQTDDVGSAPPVSPPASAAEEEAVHSKAGGMEAP